MPLSEETIECGFAIFIHTIYLFISILGLKELISTAEYLEEVFQPAVFNMSVLSSADKETDSPVRPRIDVGIASAERPKADKAIVTAGHSKVDVDATTGHPQVARGIASAVRTQVDSVPTGEMDKGKFTTISQNNCFM